MEPSRQKKQKLVQKMSFFLFWGLGRGRSERNQSLSPIATYFSFLILFQRCLPYLSQRNIQHRSQSAYLNSNLLLYHIKETCTHEFCCLPSTDQTKKPSASQTEPLKQAGLGKTKIVFKNKLASHSEVCNILEEHIPQLKNCDGFTLHRAKAGGLNRLLFDLR